MAPALGNRLTARPVAALALTVERTEAKQIPKTPLLCFIIVIILKSLVSSRRSVSLGAVACSGYSFAWGATKHPVYPVALGVAQFKDY